MLGLSPAYEGLPDFMVIIFESDEFSSLFLPCPRLRFSVFLRHRFPPGRYVIVPCTFDPGEEGEFLLRLYTDKKGYAMELTEHHPEKAWWMMCGPDYQSVLRLKIVSATGLEKQVG